jgi:integrase
MICCVFRQKRRVDGVLKTAENYSGKLRMSWETEISVIPLCTPDHRLALHKLLQEADDREKVRNGILPPKPIREASERPLNDLLSEYLQDVESRGRAVTTVKKYRKILKKLFARCRWLKLQDVTTRSFCQWRNQCGLTGKTTNDLLAAAVTFFDWLEGQRMLSENPLKYVKRTDTRGQAQFRRALSQDEVRTLLSTAPRLRAIVYLVAIYTGLRRKELNLLKWGDLHLDAPQPYVLAPASITKNKKDARLPLRPEVVEALRSIRPTDASPFQFVFNGQVPRVNTLRKDLSRAGIVFIDESGRRLDFHALRMTFGTLLAVNHVHLTDAVHLMRHSDPKLTMKIYTDASQLALSDSMAKLPAIGVHVGQRACNE